MDAYRDAVLRDYQNKIHMNLEDNDRNRTIENRRRLLKNKNLLFWYRSLYACQFSGIDHLGHLKVLEVGSGTSPLKHYYPTVLTSDVLTLDYLDYSFDCHRIDKVREIPNESIDILTMTNVLHHLKAPLIFLRNASAKLKKGGRLIMTEPYLSWGSRFIYQYIHHEYYSVDIEEPVITDIDGPLTSANSAMPYLIFFSGRRWDRTLKDIYTIDYSHVNPFTSLSYFMTGGISHRFPIPHRLYKLFFKLDERLAKRAPDLFSSFFTLKLTKI